jgi:hypothetical protein
MAKETKDFDELLLVSIDEALLSLGESAKQSIYFHVERHFKLAKDEIPQNLGKFQLALEKIFGIGSRFIELLIMRNLYGKINQPFYLKQTDQLEFVKYVDAARFNYMGGIAEVHSLEKSVF